MKMIKSLVLAGSLLAGCVRTDTAPSDDINAALPTAEQVKINLPQTATRSVGDLSSYYVVTRAATNTFNGGAAWVLTLIHTVVQFPVTSVSGNVYTWGPWTGDALDPAEYKLDVTDNGDGTYTYQFSGRNKTAGNGAAFESIISGTADPRAGELQGNGTFLLDLDASKRVDPIDNATNKGQITASYDLSARTLALHIVSTNDDGSPVDATYNYQSDTSGGGNMTFDILGNAGGTALLEDMTVRSRWMSDGSGRGDARVTGGDLGSEAAIASQCWGTDFRETYYTDNVNFLPTEGDPASCAFATADLPAPR
ncbi:MAG: hypothetical protein QM831_23310 [Kofleriaceae bacterium]